VEVGLERFIQQNGRHNERYVLFPASLAFSIPTAKYAEKSAKYTKIKKKAS